MSESKPPSKIAPAEGRVFANEVNSGLATLAVRLDLLRSELEKVGEPNEAVRAALAEAEDAMGRLAVVVNRQFSVHEAAVSSSRPPRGATTRVLVVDDDVNLARALGRLLESYDVTVCTSAEDALERLSHGERFDFILCDVEMPGIGGGGLYERLSQIDEDQADRIVFLTGGPTSAESRSFLKRVPNMVLAKPYDPRGLRDLVRRRLGRGEP